MHELVNAAVVGPELALAFADDVECYLRLESLRTACPCAACQGEPDVTGRVVRPQQQIGARGHELLKVEAVGGYALQLYWGDGHSTGIYSFDYLRRLASSQSS
ncbi:gamma-butyrobetaine hydroxylase-like domain-containing protein [Haloferula sp.]|uniref:gamma-butyrobetaine hydroxylase-like domain-containing protein n=1 Tax=Haloferula sp. TaxID=2497595 RepID=UPI00329E0C31